VGAGTDEAKLLIDHFGFDHVINYKTTKDINQSVKKPAQMVLMSIMIM
jgi:NADPH-dependent curcumin reductase CurA